MSDKAAFEAGDVPDVHVLTESEAAAVQRLNAGYLARIAEQQNPPANADYVASTDAVDKPE